MGCNPLSGQTTMGHATFNIETLKQKESGLDKKESTLNSTKKALNLL
jgi:hypothetical protein